MSRWGLDVSGQGDGQGQGRLLLRSQVDRPACDPVNLQNRDKQSPLHVAAERSYCDCVKILLAYKGKTVSRTRGSGAQLLQLRQNPIGF